MAKKTAPSKPIVCEVCGKTLHSGTTFCVSCGHHNTDVIERQVELHNQIERRLSAGYLWAWFMRMFRGF